MIDSLEETTPVEMIEIIEEFREKIAKDEDLPPSQYLDKDVKLLYHLAHKFYLCNQFKEAETFFLRLVLARPLEKSYWQGLASCRQMVENYQEALVAWAMASSLDKNEPTYLLFAAECLVYLDQKEEAAPLLKDLSEKITKEHPHFTLFTKLHLAVKGAL